MLARLKGWARAIRRDVLAVWFAARDRRTPWHARALALAVAAYALSPIDLIPDFVPVLGYLDDVVLVPLGILAVVALVPKDVMAECRTQAEAAAGRPVSRAGAAFVAAVWVLLGLAAGWAAWQHLAG